MPLIACVDCKREISDRAPACPHCGCPVSAQPAPVRPDIENSKEVRELVTAVVVVTCPNLYSDKEVSDARNFLMKTVGQVPSTEEVVIGFGGEKVMLFIKEVIQSRQELLKETAEMMGIGSGCHLCGKPRSERDPKYDFSLAKNIEKTWGKAIATLALNVVTAPLGVVMTAGPGVKANLVRCRLVMCAKCGAKYKGFLGGINVPMEICRKHPSWNRLLAAGYLNFFDQAQTAEFK